MRNILLDASFLVALIDTNQLTHDKALEALWSFSEAPFCIILPQIVIYETTFNLIRLGQRLDNIQERILKISRVRHSRIIPTDSINMFRFCSSYYHELVLGKNHKITKTNDYIIACIAKDFDALVVTGDRQMQKCLEANGITCKDFTM